MSSKDPLIGGKLLSSLRVVDLKEELEKRGLVKSGTKKDLADRLRQYVIAQEQPPEVIPTASDEELPNISMQQKLAEQNPFLRDYFTSQQELFHSQKRQKQLILEEEARKSADEGGDSSAAEDKDLNSSTEDLTTGKVKQLAKKFEGKNTRGNRKTSGEPTAQQEIIKEKSPPPTSPIKSTRQRQLENLAKKAERKDTPTEEIPPAVNMVEKVAEEKPTEEEEAKSADADSPDSSRSRSRSSSRSRSPSPKHTMVEKDPEPAISATNKENHPAEDEEASLSLPPAELNGNVKRLTEHFEGKKEENVEKVASPVQTPSDNTTKEPEVQVPEDESSREEDKPQESSSSRSSSRSRSPSPEKEPAMEQEQPEEEDGLAGDDEDRNAEALLPSSSDKPIEKIEKKVVEKKKISSSEPVARQETKKVIAPRTSRIPSLHTEKMEEEVLDYGDEEKVQTEPSKFAWSRRTLRVKNKHAGSNRTKKWVREPETKDTEKFENINSQFMAQWFSEVKLMPNVEIKEEKVAPPSTNGNENTVEFKRTFSVKAEEKVTGKMENIKIIRKVSLVPLIPSQIDEDLDKDLSPSRNPPSELVLISNLTRPFTLPQLRELLQRTGNLEDLWVDKIKSKCIAKYEKQEDAFETRAALHGVKWPQSNPKALHVDYTTLERLVDLKARDAGDVKPLIAEKPEVAENMPVREWDVGKKPKSPKRKGSRSTSRDRKRSRRSTSLSNRRHSRSPHHDRRSRGDAKEHEPLGKALDELFRKTVATPSIYWLALTPAQIAEKEEMRRKRMLERERRLAELNKPRPR